MCGARREGRIGGGGGGGVAKVIWALFHVRRRAGVFVEWVMCYAPPCCAIVVCVVIGLMVQQPTMPLPQPRAGVCDTNSITTSAPSTKGIQ